MVKVSDNRKYILGKIKCMW